jgi:hypothetical protein
MSSNFEYRYVALTPEHLTGGTPRSYGTASLGASAKVYGEVDDESVAHAFELLTRADMSRYGAAKSVNGKEYSEGGVNLVAQPDDFCGMLLYGVYGDDSSGGSSAYTFTAGVGATDPDIHTWTEDTSHILPSFTMEVGREDKEHTYTGMCVSRLSISANTGEYVMMSADFNGKAESAVSALATPTFDGASVDGLHFAGATITFGDGSASTTISTVKSISIEWNMNLNTDDACSLGSRTYVRQPEPQMREITGSIEFSRPPIANADQNVDYEDVTAIGGLLRDGDTTHPAIKATFIGASTDDALEIKIRKVRWEAPSMNVSGRDSSTMSLNFVALVDTADNIMSEISFKVDNQGSAGRYSTL